MNIPDSIRNIPHRIGDTLPALRRGLPRLALVAVALAAAYGLVTHPPFYTVPRGEVAVRTNLFTGHASTEREGRLLKIPGVHEVRSLPTQDRVYHASSMAHADGPGALQSLEGLSLGLDLTLAWRIDEKRLPGLAESLPADIERDLIAPALQASIYPVISQHTVREIFSAKRTEIEQQVAKSLRERLHAEGIELRSLQVGHVDLPPDYRRGMDGLLAEGLASEKMQFTLELKAKQVKESEMEAEADKTRRQIAAEAAEREQIIAARAQEEAMKHVLPLKQKQIEQRSLEAEAANAQRVKLAEGNATARKIEAQSEADARNKLADAEAYRVAQLSKVDADRMAREGALLTQHPLLVQKALADKLSDKVQVIIAPPSVSGGFIGSGLLGTAGTSVAANGNGNSNQEQSQ